MRLELLVCPPRIFNCVAPNESMSCRRDARFMLLIAPFLCLQFAFNVRARAGITASSPEARKRRSRFLKCKQSSDELRRLHLRTMDVFSSVRQDCDTFAERFALENQREKTSDDSSATVSLRETKSGKSALYTGKRSTKRILKSLLLRIFCSDVPERQCGFSDSIPYRTLHTSRTRT